MIKVNEIRVGNIFYFPFHNENVTIFGYAQIERDDSFKVQFKTKGGILLEPLTALSKILLTDEYLVNFGFELFPWGWVKKSSNDFGVRINLRSYNYEVSGNSSVKIEFVHQLQNLFFVLTGEELQTVANGS